MVGRKKEEIVVRMNYNFTDRTRTVLEMAREEAIRLHHGFVGTEHILLGLVREGEGVAAAVLEKVGISSGQVRQAVESCLREGSEAIPAKGELPYTSRAKKVLEFAMTEARELSHSYVGTEHILLGLLREKKGIAADVLTKLGLPLEIARHIVGSLLGQAPAPSQKESVMEAHGSSASADADHDRAGERFHVRIDDVSDRSIYEQIVEQIREAVATGTLKPGDRLPSVRRLADDLDIAPGTVARAYSELEGLGVVVTEGARGTRVAETSGNGIADGERPETLSGLLRPVAVAAFHLGADAQELRDALEVAMTDIFPPPQANAA